ncbi:MAG: von Willebrand factor type A domain-containing protein [Kofleriaceae bacterium]
MKQLAILGLLAACGGGKYMYEAAPTSGAPPMMAVAAAEPNTGEQYTDYGRNPWVDASKDHLSTFAADVDTASYTIARTKLMGGELPPAASVRVEEWVNYFKYGFPAATGENGPFAVVMDAAQHPFEANRYVLRVGVATKEKTPGERKPSSLVFLVDVSGSMSDPNKIELAKKSLQILLSNLTDKDEVSIVTYAGDSRVVLPMTSIDHRDRIAKAINGLHTGGSTAMGSGIDLAYEQAIKTVRPGHISRVIVCTDGDANVGAQSHEEILKLIEARANAGVSLSTIGFGMGNYKDTLMEQLADKGNGNNYYIDSEQMAQRVFAEQLTSTLEVAAKDVKLQVDFDPAKVTRYRLIGYENRDLKDSDFRKDEVGAGQVGWGHQVTALYEVELADPSGPFAMLHLRAKNPDGMKAVETAFAMPAGPTKLADAPADLRFAFAVAAFADIMRGNTTWTLEDVRAIAAPAASNNDRRELVTLIDKAMGLRGHTAQVAR